MRLENRKEYKTIFEVNEKSKLDEFIYNNCKKIYAERIINSIYLDTKNFEVYKQNIFSDTETFKYRFRYYNDNLQGIRFEKKINKYGKKYKLFDERFTFSKSNDSPYIIDNLFLYPKTKVQFKRNYFKYKNIRITVDEDIKFSKTKFNDLNEFIYVENKIILEQKMLNSNEDNIEKNLLFPSEKYSKFLTSIEKMYAKNILNIT